MRTFDFTPYYRATVGFDRLFDMLDKSLRSDWPPYNIEKVTKTGTASLWRLPALRPTRSNWSRMATPFW